MTCCNMQSILFKGWQPVTKASRIYVFPWLISTTCGINLPRSSMEARLDSIRLYHLIVLYFCKVLQYNLQIMLQLLAALSFSIARHSIVALNVLISHGKIMETGWLILQINLGLSWQMVPCFTTVFQHQALALLSAEQPLEEQEI